MNGQPNSPNFNTFNSPIDANTGNPIIPAAEETKTSEVDTVTEKFGPTSDYNGFGTNEQGQDKTRDEIDSEYFDHPAREQVENIYAQEEAKLQAEDDTFNAEWAAEEDILKELKNEILSARDEAAKATERFDKIIAIIEDGEKRSKQAHIQSQDQAPVQAPEQIQAQAPENPPAPQESATEPRTLDSSKLGNLAANATQQSAYYLGKDNLRYRTREEAIASFQD